MPTNEYHIIKRRYLNRARIAFSDKDVLQDFVDTFTHRDIYDPNSFPLRNTISRLFHLTSKLSFRQNATQIFRDVLEGLVFHNSANREIHNHTLFATDIDHPVMIDMAEIILSKKNIIISPFAVLLINNTNLTQDIATAFFVEEAIKSNASIILIPHVNWVNGAKLDVLKICKLIKEHNQEIITIVDGAQALANVETIIDTKECNLDIDFYIGCGQKWMGSPLPIGFARVSEKFYKNKQFKRFVFTSDYFSEFAGNEPYLDQPALDTYNIHFSILFDTVVKKFQDGKGKMKSYYYTDVINNLDPIIKLIKEKSDLTVMELPYEMRSGILAITGKEEKLSKFHNKLIEHHFNTTFDEFEFKKSKFDFIRISSPLEALNEQDMTILVDVVKSLK